MRLLLLGATGRTGRELLTQALERGHQVTALVRDPSRLPTRHERLTVHAGSVTDESAVAAAVAGQDAVLSTLGSSNPRELLGTDLMARSMRTVAGAMERTQVRRIVLLSALGAGDSAPTAPGMLRLTFATALRSIGRDKAASERVLHDSALDWTVVYPPRLTDGPLTQRYRRTNGTRLHGMPAVSRADVAHLMLALLDDESSARSSVVVTGP